jgi:hypothetical protein
MAASARIPVRLARQLAVFISIVAAAFPLVLNLFIRLDHDRYIWVITQPGRCSYLGSGPLFIWLAGQSLLIGFAAFVALVLTRRGQPHVFPTAGTLAGVLVVALAVALAVTQPEFVARAIGCAE